MRKRRFLGLVGGVIVSVLCGCVTSHPSGQESAATSAEGDAVQRRADRSIAGRCHCGQIKYEARGPVVRSSYCDCPGCKRATGTLKAPFVTVPSEGFKVTAGDPAQFRAASGEGCDANGTWYFCSRCGTQVFWKGDRGDEIDIFAGTLDDVSIFRPKS